jgi:hypothetical protein
MILAGSTKKLFFNRRCDLSNRHAASVSKDSLPRGRCSNSIGFFMLKIMAGKIHRQKKSSEFVTLDTHCLRNKSLKWDAKGLHSYLMQLPDDWQINIADLEKRGADGRDATTSPMKALIQCGYVVREQTFDSKGRFEGFDYHIFERPEHGLSLLTNGYSENGKTENGKTENGLSVNGKTATSKVLSYSKKSNSKNEGRGNEEKNAPSPPKDFDEMLQLVNAEVATIEAEKEKISPVPAAPSFPGSDISEEADELKNGVVRRDGPNYEAKKEKVSCHHSCGPGDFWEGGKCARMGCYTKESPTHVVTAVDGQTLPGALVTTVEGLSLEQTTRETAAEALTRRISNPLADNAIDAGKLIEVWCAENSETVKWAYDAARRKLTPDDLSARIIDFCGCYANSVEPGKQVLFFGDPARMFKNGLTKWLQTQNKFDREQAAKPNTGKFQQQDNAAAYVAPKAVRPVQTFYE